MNLLRHHTLHILIIWIVVTSILYSTLSVARHNRFQSGGFDLGLYDQSVWQYSRFLYPYNTVKDRFILGDHLSLTLPLLAPLYWLWDDIRMLLVFQVVWVMISTLAIYKLALARKLSALSSLGIAIIYSLFYGIQYLIFFDFHPVAIGIGLLAWFCYFWETKRLWWTITTCIVLLLTQENMGIALSGVSIIYLFRKQFRFSALLFFSVGILWSLIAAKLISWFSPVGFQYWPSITLHPLNIAKSFIDVAEKRQVLWYSLSAFSFLPLGSPGALFAVLLDLAQYFSTGPEFSRMWSPFMHHRGILSIFLALGSIDVLVIMKKKHINVEILVCALLISCFIQQYIFHYPLNKLTKSSFWKQESWMEDNREMFTLIPADASLATQQSLIPHLSHRKEIYLVWPRVHDREKKPCGQKSCWWLDFGGNPHYLLIDLHPGQWITQLLETNENVSQALSNMEKEGVIRREKKIHNIALYTIIYPVPRR